MKQNILLLHGALGTKEQFQGLIQELENEFNVHSFDFEGHGANASTNGFSMDLFADNVVEYLKANKIGKINIFGYSMGGYVGLNVARKNPELVDKIVTLGTKFGWTKEVAEKEIRMLNPDKIEEKVPKFAAKLASIHTANNWKEVVRKTADMMYGLGTGKKMTNEELSKITHETLIGLGSLDRMVSQEESLESVKALPNANFQVIEGFPHLIEKIDSEKLASVITGFILVSKF